MVVIMRVFLRYSSSSSSRDSNNCITTSSGIAVVMVVVIVEIVEEIIVLHCSSISRRSINNTARFNPNLETPDGRCGLLC